MPSIVSAVCNSFKKEILELGHCFNPTVVTTGSSAIYSNEITDLGTTEGVSLGMIAGGANMIGFNTVVSVGGATSVYVDGASTGSITGASVTFTGDTFMMSLITESYVNDYGPQTTNYSNLGSDEVANGNGYTSGGQALTNPTLGTSGSEAVVNFANVSWTSATFSVAGAVMYNSAARVFGTSGTNTTGGGRACSVYSFNGTQSVTSGTFTLTMPPSGLLTIS